MNINICRLGDMAYAKALEIQEKLFDWRVQGKIKDTLLLVEHPPVLTIGKNGQEANVLVPEEVLQANGVNIYKVNRGGDVTYHGPGQIVGYPVFDLNGHGKDSKQFMWNLEEVTIALLKAEYGIEAHRGEKKYTGVWVGNEKITAVGIAVRKWVSMHGFAFNVNTNLEHFKWIVPCGITDKGVTSLQKLTGEKQDFEKVNSLVIRYFCEIFGVEPVRRKVEELKEFNLIPD